MSPEQDDRSGGRFTVCPSCDGRLVPRELACKDCGLVVKTQFAGNEFVGLDEDNLHVLRIFVACEGRIRDMERALGVSYPTVKSRLAALRNALGVGPAATETPPARRRSRWSSDRERAADVLDRLESGEIEFDEALESIKGLSPGETR